MSSGERHMSSADFAVLVGLPESAVRALELQGIVPSGRPLQRLHAYVDHLRQAALDPRSVLAVAEQDLARRQSDLLQLHAAIRGGHVLPVAALERSLGDLARALSARLIALPVLLVARGRIPPGGAARGALNGHLAALFEVTAGSTLAGSSAATPERPANG